MSRPPFRHPVWYLLAGHFLLGLAHVAMLPPWEGFDETAHYSYLQQLADTRTLPRWGDRMSKAVEEYAFAAPLPYTSVAPFEANGGLTYRALFLTSSPEAVSRATALVHRRPSAPWRYVPGTKWNWEAHHPPLYYLALAPVYLATRQLSWGVHLFSLRFTSYLMAWVALILGVYAAATADASAFAGSRSSQEAAILGIGLWPVLMPSWFPDMARLGNDSLSALILAGVWLVSVRAVSRGLSIGHVMALGALLGAGCLTKAFFLPVTVGMLGFWSFGMREPTGARVLASRPFQMTVLLLAVTSIAGWWYAGHWRPTGVAVGLHQAFARALLDKFSVAQWLRGHAALLTSIAWCGTWSLARPAYLFLAPLAGMVLLVGGAYASALRRFPARSVVWLPAWLVAPLTLGLSYEVLVRLAWNGEGRGVNGYYLHFLAPALGTAVGVGLGTQWSRGAFRRVVAGLTVYALLFEVAVSWAQVMLFSGWLFKSGSSPFYQSPDPLPFFLGLPDALARLAVLAYPLVGATAWIAGGALVLGGLLAAWRASASFAHPGP